MEKNKIMKQWDFWRKEIASGNTGSAPRDWFEAILDEATNDCIVEVGPAEYRIIFSALNNVFNELPLEGEITDFLNSLESQGLKIVKKI